MTPLLLNGDRVAALEARVAALEQQLAALPPSLDQLSPSYLSLTPAGVLGANFTGLVNALGLILPAGTNFSPGPTNEIVWERSSDGAATAQISSVQFVNQILTTLASLFPSGVIASTLTLAAQDSGSTTGASLSITADPGSLAAEKVSVSTAEGAHSATLLDGNGKSTFPSLGGPANGVGALLVARSGNSISFEWTGSAINCWVDATPFQIYP